MITTRDTLFGGTLRLEQPEKGHRAGTDAVLLAASCPPGEGLVCDLGCGVGTVGLRVAQHHPGRRVLLIDNDPLVLGLAARNGVDNGLAERCMTVRADVLGRDFGQGPPLERVRAAVVLSNPPFAEAGRQPVSPTPLRASAHVLAGTLDGWIRAAIRLLAPKGDLIVIHRAEALADLLAALAGRFGGIRIRPVLPQADSAASRILVRARLGSRTPLTLLPPLVLHRAGGGFTDEAEAIHAGTASVDWGEARR